MTVDIQAANRTAVTKMQEAHPRLVGIAQARDVIPGSHDRLFLHAGPPLTWDQMPGPMRGAVIGALIFEGLAADSRAATALVESGELEFAPCHDHQAVGPMAGLISPSMAVYVVEDTVSGTRAFSGINEGYGRVLRYGAYQEDVQTRLAFLNREFADTLHQALTDMEGLDLKALIAESLHMGDEAHNRSRAGGLLFLRALAAPIAAAAATPARARDILGFLADNALASLNPVMAACKIMTLAGHGVEGSTLITTMARNGFEFGIRVSGLGDRWFTAPAATPDGLYFPGFDAEHANPDIGDSTITETAGVGAFAMAAAPAIVTFVSGTARLAWESTHEMYEICLAEHAHFTIPALDFRGTPTGIDLQKVVETGMTPRINTGIAHREAGMGQIGAGLVRPGLEVFTDAFLAFAQEYGFAD